MDLHMVSGHSTDYGHPHGPWHQYAQLTSASTWPSATAWASQPSAAARTKDIKMAFGGSAGHSYQYGTWQ